MIEKSDSGPANDRDRSAEKGGALASMRIPNFRLLFTGSTLNYAAQWIQQVTVGWLVYDITGSGTILGSISFVRSLSALGIIPMIGFIIDRIRRRNLLMILNGMLFTITLALGLLLVLGIKDISFLFIFSLIAGMVGSTDMTLRQVLIFDLVPRAGAPNAIALLQTGWSLMRSLGPAVGGFLILWFGPGGNFLIQAGAYLLIIITILQIRFPEQKLGQLHSSPLKNFKEAFQYMMKQPVTRNFWMLSWSLPLLIVPIFFILPPIYAVQVFGDTTGRVLGFLLGSVGLGGIIGGFTTASLNRMDRRGVLCVFTLFLLSICLIAFAFITTLWLALLLLTLAGFFEIIFLTTDHVLIQLAIPDHLRGGVTSVMSLNNALTLLGGFIAGAGSDLLGGPKVITIILAGATATLAVLFLIFSPTVRNYRLKHAMSHAKN